MSWSRVLFFLTSYHTLKDIYRLPTRTHIHTRRDWQREKETREREREHIVKISAGEGGLEIRCKDVDSG